MDLYGQDPELALLAALVPELASSTVIDVGAEQGAFVDALLDAGAREVYALEAHPENVAALTSRFARDPRVSVHGGAISDADGTAELHVSHRPDGSPLSFGHTLLAREDTKDIVWPSTLLVGRRSIGSLVAEGVLPARAGILKVDTEGHDLAVVRGLGSLQCDVVMVEHWTDLPNGLGSCPWRIEDMLAQLRPRGFSHFALLVHRGEFAALRWDDGHMESGAMGNLVFIHDDVLSRALQPLLVCAGRLADVTMEAGRMYMDSAAARLRLIRELEDVAAERLALIDQLHGKAAQRRSIWKRLTPEPDRSEDRS